MARLSYPLGFSIKDNTGLPNSGASIDERSVFASNSDLTNYPVNFLYRGLSTYVIGNPYHGTGVTSNSGFYTRYYNGSSYSWQGLDADTVDDKHANGTMDSSSNATVDPATSSNIVDHINRLYTVTSSLTTSRSWLESVDTYALLLSTYPAPSTGDSALVENENTIYTYNGATWVATTASVAMLSGTVDGIVSKSWYSRLNDLVTNYADYVNQAGYSVTQVLDNNDVVKANGEITATNPFDTIKFKEGSNITLDSNPSAKTITISATGGSIVTPAGPNTAIQYNNSSSFGGSALLTFDGIRLGIGSSTSKNVLIGYSTASSITTGTSNIGIGYNTLDSLTAGVSNVAIGESSSNLLTTGELNTSIGTASLLHNTTGINNVSIGAISGFNKVGSSNVYIGYSAGYSTTSVTESNRLYIANTHLKTLLYGEFDNGVLTVQKDGDTATVQFNDSTVSISKNIDGDLLFKDASNTEVSLSTLNAASSLTASNGITKTGVDVKLGGVLTEDTEIDLNSRSLSYIGTNGANTTSFLFSASGILYQWNNQTLSQDGIIQIYSGSIESPTTHSGIGKSLLLSTTNLNSGLNSSLNLLLGKAAIGGNYPAVYADIYGNTIPFAHTDFTADEEIVNKAYVDWKVSTITPGISLPISQINYTGGTAIGISRTSTAITEAIFGADVSSGAIGGFIVKGVNTTQPFYKAYASPMFQSGKVLDMTTLTGSVAWIAPYHLNEDGTILYKWGTSNTLSSTGSKHSVWTNGSTGDIATLSVNGDFDIKGVYKVNGVPISTGGGGGMVYPEAGIPNSTGSAWGSSYNSSNKIPANSISNLAQSQITNLVTDLATITNNIKIQYAGTVTSVNITDLGSGLISTNSIVVNLNSSADFTGQFDQYTIPALTNYQLIANTNYYLVVEYNSGTPQYAMYTDNNLVNHSTIIKVAELQWINNNGVNEVQWFSTGNYGLGLANKTSHRQVHETRFYKEFGIAVSITGTRNISMTPGKIWYDGLELNTLSINSATVGHEMYHYYPVSGSYTLSKVSQYPNNVYNNGTDLVSATNNKNIVIYFWRQFKDSGHVSSFIIGGQYNSVAEALNTQLPATIPSFISNHFVYLGRLIITTNSNTGTFYQETSKTVGQTPIQNHNDLANIQGGTTGEYYHITSSQLTVLSNTSGTNTGDQDLSTLMSKPATAVENNIAIFNSNKEVVDSGISIRFIGL